VTSSTRTAAMISTAPAPIPMPPLRRWIFKIVVMALAFAATSCEAKPSSHGSSGDGGGDPGSSSTGDGATAVSIICGDSICAHVCCTPGAACAEKTAECVSPDNGHGFYMTCDGSEDCADGQVCCIGVGGGAYGSTYCITPTDCVSSFQSVACHGGGDCPGSLTCKPSPYADSFVLTLLSCQ
jgi:hypothetical protein